MKLVNKTDLPCRLFTGALSENVNGGWLVGRATYSLPTAGGGELVPFSEAWPIFSEPLKTDFGVFPADGYPFRAETEVVVVGTARSNRAVRQLEVRLEVGPHSNRMVVFGDRRWTGRGADLVASDPEPFLEKDLGLQNAFGGITPYEGMDFPHPLNPVGKGFYLSAADALGKPLANVERPDWPVRRWTDQPMVATWSPLANSPAWQMAEWIAERTRTSRQPLDEKEIAEKSRQIHPSAAAPPLLFRDLRAGDPVQIDLGTERNGFRIPQQRAAVRTQVGTRVGRRTLQLSGLWVIAPKRLVVVTWIGRFKYGLRSGEDRKAFVEVA